MARKTKHRLKLHRGIVIPAFLAILVLLGLGLFFNHRQSSKPAPGPSSVRPENSIDYSPAKPGDNAANNARKGSPNSSSTIPESTPNSGTSSSQLNAPSISIAGANANGNGITVSATAQNASNGACNFNFSRSDGGMVVQSYSEPVQYIGTYYSCPLHSVEMPSPASGNWYVSATLSGLPQSASDKWPGPVHL